MLATAPTRQVSKDNGRRRRVQSSAMVMVHGGTYLVDLGARHAPRFHTVQKDKTCSCGVPRCRAVLAVDDYLRGGGQRASEPAVNDPPTIS